METKQWVEILLAQSVRYNVPSKTKVQRRILADWIRDDCATRKMPLEEVEAELEKHGLKK